LRPAAHAQPARAGPARAASAGARRGRRGRDRRYRARRARGAHAGRLMRIAPVHPTYWPEVRRGSERVIHDLGVALVDRGHEVTVLTTHNGPASAATEDGVRVLRARRLPEPPGLAAYEYHLTTVPAAYRRLRSGAFDVAH